MPQHPARETHAMLTERIRYSRARAHETGPLARALMEVTRADPAAAEGILTISARLSSDDLSFYAFARNEVSTLASIIESILILHVPEGYEESWQRRPLSCRSCRQPWPCRTIGAVDGGIARGDVYPGTG